MYLEGGVQFVESGDAATGRLLEDIAPDGRTLLFTSSEGAVSSSSAAIGAPANGDPQTKSDSECPRFSPDGRWITYSERDGGIFVIPRRSGSTKTDRGPGSVSNVATRRT